MSSVLHFVEYDIRKDTKMTNLLILLLPLTPCGVIFFIWIWLDLRDAHKHGRKQRGPHRHHVLLGLWPAILECLVLLLYGKISLLMSWFLVLVTGLLYLICGIWDFLREVRVSHELERVSEPMTPLTRVALLAPLFVIMMIGIPATSLGFLVVFALLFFPSGNVNSLMAILFVACWSLGVYLTHVAFDACQDKARRKRDIALEQK